MGGDRYSQLGGLGNYLFSVVDADVGKNQSWATK